MTRRSQNPTRKTKKPTLSKRERVAYHEAGHVIMAVALRVRFIRATIVPDQKDGSLGHVQVVFPNPDDCDDFEKLYRLCKRLGMVLLAGLVAESLVTGRRSWISAQDDLQQSTRLARRVVGDALASRWIQALMIETELFFDRPDQRLLVEIIASALLAKRTMSARRLRAVVKESRRNLPKHLRSRLGT